MTVAGYMCTNSHKPSTYARAGFKFNNSSEGPSNGK
jgi:hypothetical protein